MSDSIPTETVSDVRLAELAGAYWPDGVGVFGQEIRECLQELQRVRKVSPNDTLGFPGEPRVRPVLEYTDQDNGDEVTVCPTCGQSHIGSSREELRQKLLEVTNMLADNSAMCKDLHHAKADQHEGHMDCPVEQRIGATEVRARAILAKETK